jgi:hypothetical protein
VRKDPAKDIAESWNSAVLEAGLRNQNCDKGFDRFIRKFNQEEEMTAIMAIQEGAHDDIGTAILFTQENRRCLLLDTLYNRSYEDVMWHMMRDWARFRPRATRPKTDSGQLFYPPEFQHIFEQYWQVLERPLEHEDAYKESDFSEERMQEFTAAMQGQSQPGQPRAFDAETGADKEHEGLVNIAKQAAGSRCCMVQDARNHWADVSQEMHRSSAVTDGPVHASGSVVGTESVPGTGSNEAVCGMWPPALHLSRFFLRGGSWNTTHPVGQPP